MNNIFKIGDIRKMDKDTFAKEFAYFEHIFKEGAKSSWYYTSESDMANYRKFKKVKEELLTN